MGLMDRRALEGMPLKLMMTALILALSIPPFFASLSYIGYSQELSMAMHEAEAIKEAAMSAFVGGPGNVRKVSVSLNEGPDSCSIRVGGAHGEGRSRSIDILYQGNLAATVALENSGLCIVGAEGESMVIWGKVDLRVTCCQSIAGDFVVIERVQ